MNTEKDAMALAVLDEVAEGMGGPTDLGLADARAHLASRIAELEMESAGATAAYERFTAYTITHNGAMRYCSSDMRDAYAEMSARATRAEAELAAVREDAERYRFARESPTVGVEVMTDDGIRSLSGPDLDAAIDAARGGE